MRSIHRRILSALLCMGLMIGLLAGVAWAVDAKSIKLSVSTKDKLYFRESDVDGDRADDVTVTAEITPKQYDGQIK